MPSFWYLIQRSSGDCTSNNDRTRKCALYLFQQILTNEEYKHIEIKEEKFNRFLILIDEKTKQFWIDFIVLYEALDDGVVHLIKPLGEEISDSQSMELCLESYLERWLNVAENLSSCLLALLSRLQTIKWSHLSLVRVLYSLQTFALNHQNQSLLNDEHIKIFSSLILTQFNTYAPVLHLNASLDTRLFSLDNTLLEYRQTAFLLDLLDIRNTDILKTIFNPLIENIRTAYQRPYMSINNVRRSIELFSGLIQENYFHSSNFIKDWLSSSIRLVVRESLNFIKIHSIKQSIAFAKLPIVFLMVGNHEDISRFFTRINYSN
ncbi:unnamed protein product [Rotaria socialis]|uniref:Uncharacterized protein n=1 Tax=Rotaria socialis TaxID=392032 RepID=A0A817X2D7_9BILA|nr:unnamed protein product [Rotaria socialis]